MTAPPPPSPPPSPRRASPVERFLGPSAGGAGPFSLLGVDRRVLSDDVVISALERRLASIAQHPERDTPEADEVRLALHAAAAQLLDPKVRRILETRWSAERASRPRVPAAPAETLTPAALLAPPGGQRAPAPQTEAADPVVRSLTHDAILTLGMMGGWNRRSLRRLVALSHARGANARQLSAALRALATRRRPPPQDGARRAPGDPSRASRAVEAAVIESGLPASGRAGVQAGLIAIFIVAACVLVIGTMILVARASRPPSDPGQASDPDRGSLPASVPPDAIGDAPDRDAARHPRRTPPEAPDPGVLDPSANLRELEASIDGLSTDRDAAGARFEAALARLERDWPRYTPDQISTAQNAVVEFVYRAGSTGAVRVADALASSAELLADRNAMTNEGVTRSVFAMGMLARLSRERDIGVAAGARVEGTLAHIMGQARSEVAPDFPSGATAAARIVPDALTGTGTDRAAWSAWRGAVEGVSRGDRARRDALLLAGLETLLVRGEAPDARKDAYDAIADLVLAVTWREDDPSRRALLRWFDDRRVEITDLHCITTVLATRSSAERVDVTMVLSAAAGPPERAALRARYASAWSIEGSISRDQFQADWAAAARAAIDRSREARDDLELLTAALELARLSHAIEWHWRGETEHAARVMEGIALRAASAPPASPSPAARRDPGDASWAVRYAGVGRAPAGRLELIAMLEGQAGPLPEVVAEVLVVEALTGTPAEVRARAQDIVRAHAHEPSVVNAVLEVLPRAPRSIDPRVVEDAAQRDLPSPRAPAWPVAARRALVERLLELLAQSGDLRAIDDLAGEIAMTYVDRAADAPLAPDALRAGVVAPDRAAARLWARWRKDADAPTFGPRPAMSLDAIEQRRQGRLRVAEGMVQSFAGEQASLAELLAYVACLDQPDAAGQAGVVLADLARQRREARGVLAQISAGERAIARLWLLRTGESLP